MQRPKLSFPFFIGLILTLGLGISSCKKEKDLPLFENYNPAPANCFNGIQDSNELAPDCGGNCPPCSSTSASCTLPSDELYVENFSTKTLLSQTYNIQGSQHIITSTFTDDFVLIFKFPSFPNLYTNYSIQNTPDEGEVDVDLEINSNSYQGSGTMELTYSSDTHEFHVCTGSFQIGFNTAQSEYRVSYTF